MRRTVVTALCVFVVALGPRNHLAYGDPSDPNRVDIWVLDFVHNGALLGQADDGFDVRHGVTSG